MSIPYVIEGDSFRPSAARAWGNARAATRSRGFIGVDGRAFDLHPDGERAIGAWHPESEPAPAQDTLILAFNLSGELQRLAPTRGR